MAKSVKQQMYEQLANQHVQQALNNIGMQQFQEAYNQWNSEQEGLANFEAQYNEWANANPVQTPAQPSMSAQPSLPVLKAPDPVDFFKPKTASGTDINAQAAKDIDRHAFNEAYARQQQEEQNLAADALGKEKKREQSVNDFVNAINTDEFRDIVKQNQVSQLEPTTGRLTRDQRAAVAKRVTPEQAAQWLSPDVKLTDEEKEAAKAYASSELQKYSYGPNHQPKFDTAQDRQHYADMVNLINKTNPVASAMTGMINAPLNLARLVRDGARSLGNQLGGLAAAIGDKTGLTEGATQRFNESRQAADEMFNQNDAAMKTATANAQTQNPALFGGGNMAGQMGMYLATTPLISAGAGAMGLGAAGTAVANQIGQAGQDVALDVYPEYQRMKDEGNVDYSELAKRFGTDVAANIAMGALPVLAGGNYDYLTKTVGNNADIFKTMDASGALKNAPDAVREAIQTGQEIATAPTRQIDEAYNQLPTLEEDVLSANNNQFRSLMDNYNNQFKDNSSMRNIFTPEDMDAATNSQFRSLMDENLIPERLNPVAKMEEYIPSQLDDELRAMNDEMGNMWGDTVAKTTDNVVAADDTTKNLTDMFKSEGYSDDQIKQMVKNPTEAEIERASRLSTNGNVGQGIDNAPQIDVKQVVDNPALTADTNANINDYLFPLEQPFTEKGKDAFRRVVNNITTNSEEGYNITAQYYEISDALRKTTDEATEAALRGQLDDLRASAKNVDKSVRGQLKDALDYMDAETALADYKRALNGDSKEAVDAAARKLDAIRNRIARHKGADKELSSMFSGGYGTAVNRPKFAYSTPPEDMADDELVQGWLEYDASKANKATQNTSKVPGANPLQFFAEGPADEWATSKYRTNTIENMGWGDQSPIEDYAYRRFKTAEQHEVAAERAQTLNDLIYKDSFDAPDVKAAMEMQQDLLDSGDIQGYRRLSGKTRFEATDKGQTIQAFAEYNKNTAVGALQDAARAQDDLVLNPWRSTNQKAVQGNKRIAKALEDMGNKWKSSRVRPELTHDQIKQGVITELEKEVGSVETHFNDNDIEFLTQLAEDKSMPVWKITSEIEHKLNTGNWYSLDESLPIPQPTNKKLQSALNSLIETDVRQAEKTAPSLQQITEEVRNTLSKEAADFEGQFTDNDIDYIANLINNGATKNEIAEALDLKLATGNFGITDETLQEVNNIFKQISNYDVNSKQFAEGQQRAYELLANEILPNATPMEKFEAWRYLAMLGNPKTMIRNKVGNDTFNVVTGISNNIAAVAEAGIDKASKTMGGNGIQRTKSVLNPIADNGLIKAAAEDADLSRYPQIRGTKYEKFGKDTLRQYKSVFNSKLAQFYEKVTDAGISDYKAVKRKYSTSLAGYLKANGYDNSIFDAETKLARLKNLSQDRLLTSAENAELDKLTKDVAALEKGRDFALKQAEYSTFHEDNKFAQMLTRWSRMSKEEGTGIGHVLIEGTVPFKKTPANVLRSGYEYSPLGAISSIKKTGKLIYENTGKRAGNLADTYLNSKGKEVSKTLAADVIDSWSKTLTGTGLTALGFYLYNKGILHSSDPDTQYQDQLEGHQNYAIEINGKSYTIDWAAPTVMPLMVGAEAAKLWDSTGKDTEDFYDNLDEYLAIANRLADPMIETSMLSGVRDTLETAANAVQNNEEANILPILGYNIGTGYLTQAVPTVGGQIARTIDPVRRSTYSDKDGVAGTIDKQIKKQMNKIPGLSMLNQPYVDTYGRTQQNSPFNNPLPSLAYQMLSPGYLSDINETDADRISREAYEVGKTASTLPKWQSKFTDSEGNRVSPEDYTTASKAYGEANYEIRDALANDEWFNSLDDAQKEEIVKGINTISQHVGNAAIDPEYSKDSKAYNAYKDGGVKGLLEYYKEQNAKATAKESGLSATSQGFKEIQEDLQKGNMQAAQQKIDEAKVITDAGINSYGYKAYQANKTRIPDLQKWTEDYTSIDSAGNSDGFVNQAEFLDWVKKNGYTESQAAQYAKIYGNWKNVPYLKKDGTWGFHKTK